MPKPKMYILDTNILIHDPEAFFGFSPEIVAIPTMVLEELDHFKTENSQRGRNARETIRHLDILRQKGSLNAGVKLDTGGTVQILFTQSADNCPTIDWPATPDNKILETALCMQKKGYDVTFITKDINMRVKADVLNLTTEDYLKDVVSHDEFYKGWMTVQVPAVQLKKDMQSFLSDLAKDYKFTLNEYVLAESQHNPFNYRLFRYVGTKNFKEIFIPDLKWNIKPRNPQQLIALDLLLDDSIKLVSLLGPAGTGKTFLALVAGLHKIIIEQVYNKMLISRPVVPLGPDIGYLPGDIQEKLHSWMQPIYDNMDFIVHTANSKQNSSIYYEEQSQEEQEKNWNKKDRKRDKHKEKRQEKVRHGFPSLDELSRQGKMSLEAITYMRGRSIPYQYIFIDEVQNLTPHEVKTIISRVGDGSKIVLAGDPYQIDSPYLDFTSNGLMVASQRFKNNTIFGTAFLTVSERSELSKLAGELL